jgi:2-octaprenyl-6-methoxyphenol hydroxylase
LIKREELKVPVLGYVVNYNDLIKTLLLLPCLSGIQLIRPAHIIFNTEQHDNIVLKLSNECEVRGQILVQAEGGGYTTAKSEKNLLRNYQQIGIVAHVQSSLPVAHRAFERFTDQGPLALLPQNDNGGYNYALVWCVHPDTAYQLLSLDDSAFLMALAQAFGGRLGSFLKVSERSNFPLSLSTSHATTARKVTIGNAAQTLHPVAGQGLNLGLRDAKVLADLLTHGIESDTIEKFFLSRKTDRSITILATDIMARIFSSSADGTLLQAILGLSLGMIDIVYPAKHLFVQQMLFGKR